MLFCLFSCTLNEDVKDRNLFSDCSSDCSTMAKALSLNHYDLGVGPLPTREEVERVSQIFLMGLSNEQDHVEHSSICHICNGYYGPAFFPPQPTCATCHAFLYANDVDGDQAHLRQTRDESGQDPEHSDDSDRDSGNEEEIPEEIPVHQDEGEDVQQPGSEDEGVNDPEPGIPNDPVEEPHGLEAFDFELEAPILVPEQALPLPEAPLLHNNPEQQADLSPDEVLALGQEFYRLRFGNEDAGAEIWPRPSTENHDHDNGIQRPAYVESLSQRLALLTEPRPNDDVPPGLIESLPPEVLLVIFSHLDDIALYAVGNVCRRWRIVLRDYINSSQWKSLTCRRWPLFKPLSRVKDWFSIYSALIESSFCIACIYQMAQNLPNLVEAPLRNKRLVNDLRNLIKHAPDGIEAQPLDSNYYHWQASITGPVGSPYEGGKFFLYLKVPFGYPFKPPEVRFITRIFHPNVSRHGDIGIDSLLQNNWVVALNIPKVLISIQSLLTDPYCHVCMEPEIAGLYRENRRLFDGVARKWTWKFAMTDAFPSVSKL